MSNYSASLHSIFLLDNLLHFSQAIECNTVVDGDDGWPRYRAEKWIPFDFLNVHTQENLMQLYNCNTINRFNQSDSHCGNFFTLCVETKLKKKKKKSRVLLIRMQLYAGDRWLYIKAHTNRPSSAATSSSSSSHHQQTISYLYYLNSTN